MLVRTFIFAFAFLLFTLAAPPANAERSAPIGSVVEIEGAAAHTLPDGSLKLLNVNESIFLGETLVTQPGARLLISFIDDTELTLGEDASLTIDKFIFDPDDLDTAGGDFSIPKGAFLFVSGLIGKNPVPKVNVKTSYGTIGLRGTTVWGGVLDGEYGVLVQEGEVDVTNDGGTTRVTKGLGTFMKNRMERPRLPKTWAAAKSGRAVAAIALKNKDVVRQRLEARKQANAAARRTNLQSPGAIKKNLERQLAPVQQRQNGEKEGRFDDFKQKKENLERKKALMNNNKGND